MRYLIVLVCFWLLGCSEAVCNGQYTYASKDFTQGQVEALGKAVAEWNKTLGYDYFSVNPDLNCSCAIEVKSEQLKGEAEDKAGVYRGYSGNIEIRSELETVLWRQTVMHELGHSIGLEHVQGKGHLMSPAPGLHVDAVDLAECQAIGFCD